MIELIPAIDIIDGKCVRLSQGDYASKKVYNERPADMARAFEDHGFRRLHVVDLDGAASHHIVNYRALEQIASRTSLAIDFGGGIKTGEDLAAAFGCGAAMVTLGSIAVHRPDLFKEWLDQYGTARIILGADVKNNRIAVNGWKEESPEELTDFLDRYIKEMEVRKVLCTDISRDGMLKGPSTPLYRDILSHHPDVYLIASGGVGCLDDIFELDKAGIPAVVFGKALYEGRISLKELSRFI